MKLPENPFFQLSRSFILVFGVLSVCCSNSRMVAGNVTPTSLTGDWVVTNQTYSVIIIPPLCKSIQKGSIFNFNEGEVKVYSNASLQPCDIFGYKISGNNISFIKDDMLWLCSYELNNEELKIISDSFFKPASQQNATTSANHITYRDTVVVTLNKTR